MTLSPGVPSQSSWLTAANLHRVITAIVSLVVAWDHYRQTSAPVPVVAKVDPALSSIEAERKVIQAELKKLQETRESLVQIRESILDKLLTKHP